MWRDVALTCSPPPLVQEQVPRNKDGSPLAEQELVVGLKAYFNRSCSLLLLYPQERSQAEEVNLTSSS